MKGYQVSFITEMNRRIEGKQTAEWLMRLAKELGIAGVTTFAGVEGVGSHGRHSARFFELADQPIEIMMAMTDEKAEALFARVRATDTRLFYIKTAIEYGEVGMQADGSAMHG
jgi:PII-like signaling protein